MFRVRFVIRMCTIEGRWVLRFFEYVCFVVFDLGVCGSRCVDGGFVVVSLGSY